MKKMTLLLISLLSAFPFLTCAEVENIDIRKIDWKTRKEIDPIDDNVIYMAAVDTYPWPCYVESEGCEGKKISLVFMCSYNELTSFIDWRQFVTTAGNLDIIYRVDKKITQVLNLDVISNDGGQASVFPKSAASVLEEIVNSNSFAVEITPYNKSPIIAVFNTQGADQALADIRKACNW